MLFTGTTHNQCAHGQSMSPSICFYLCSTDRVYNATTLNMSGAAGAEILHSQNSGVLCTNSRRPSVLDGVPRTAVHRLPAAPLCSRLPRPSAPVCCSLLPPSVTCGLDCGSPLWSEGDDDTLLYCPPLEAIICLVASLAGPAVLFPSAARAARECRPRRPGRPSHGAPAAAARHCRLQSAGTCSGAAPNPTQPSRRGDTGSPAAAAATDRRVRSRRLPA